MKVEKRDGSDERRVLTGMIVDRKVLGRITSIWQRGLFASKWSNLVAGWCIEYFKQYDKPPRSNIEGLFHDWSEQSKDEATVRIVERFLQELSNDYKRLAKELNSDYVIDLAGRYFNRIRIRRLSEELKDDLDSGQQRRADERLAKYNKIELADDGEINVLGDYEAMVGAFEEHGEPLIEYPGALGKFFGDTLSRDMFISFEGPEKRGKSYMLLDVAWRAVLQRRRVAYFEAGDMGKNRYLRRFACRAAKRPLYPGVVKRPVSIERNGQGTPDVTFKKRRFKSGLMAGQAVRAMKSVMENEIKTKCPDYLKLRAYPGGTLSVNMIQAHLDNWEKSDWVPDVVVIDYADIMVPDTWSKDDRDRINDIWIALRRLSQSRHCLVVTATQTDAASYSTKKISMRHFTGDKRKRSHVRGSVAINQTPEEKKQGIMRLDWIVLGERENPGRFCYIAECRALAQIAVVSCF